MTRNELLELLRGLEHLRDTNIDAKFCPKCGQNKKARLGPHDFPCELAEAIAWLEDEGNKEVLADPRIDAPDMLEGWVLR